MSSYFFHHDAFLAPPPPEYVLFSQRRAVWQAVGKQPGGLSAKEWAEAVLFLGLEAEDQRKRSERKQ